MTTATAAELETAWAARVRDNREQVDAVREVPDRDFYAPVSSLFVADPRRTGEEALDALLSLARPTDRWLDIGAGAGRYALPLALRVAEVIAVEPSASMRNALRSGKAEHGLDNLTLVGAAWPDALAELGEPPDRRRRVHRPRRLRHRGDRAVPRWDGAGRGSLCVAMLTDRSPASVADPFWPIVHGMERVPLPALPELEELLRARGREPHTERVDRAPRTFDSFDGLATFVRRLQLGGDAVARAGPRRHAADVEAAHPALADRRHLRLRGRTRAPRVGARHGK